MQLGEIYVEIENSLKELSYSFLSISNWAFIGTFNRVTIISQKSYKTTRGQEVRKNGVAYTTVVCD